MDYECPNCGEPLEHCDTFGDLGWVTDRPGGKKTGNIYCCPNEECEERHFHTFEGYAELHSGYPC